MLVVGKELAGVADELSASTVDEELIGVAADGVLASMVEDDVSPAEACSSFFCSSVSFSLSSSVRKDRSTAGGRGTLVELERRYVLTYTHYALRMTSKP